MRSLRPLPTRLGTSTLLLALSAPAWALNILVTNDDSCNAEGINVLMDTLESAGHSVSMYAPAGEQSGRSGSISTAINQVYDISNVGFHGPTGAANRYCVRVPMTSPAEGDDTTLSVSATPKDAMLVGLAVMGEQGPDLVISGINDGQNIGITATSSGTVGAAVAAIQQGIPAIAVSRNRFSSEQGMSFADLARLVATVVDELEDARGDTGSLLPPRTGLNINNPAGIPRGIAHTQLGTQSDLRLGPAVSGNTVIVGFNGLLKLEDLIDPTRAAELAASDTAGIEDFAAAGLDIGDESSMSVAGFITISTIDGDFSAGLRQRELIQLRLRNLSLEAE